MRGVICFVVWCLVIVLVVLLVVGVLCGWFVVDCWLVIKFIVQVEFYYVKVEQICDVVCLWLGCGFFVFDLDVVQKVVVVLLWVELVEVSKCWLDILLLCIYECQFFVCWNDKQLISCQGQVFDVLFSEFDISLFSLYGLDDWLVEVVSFYVDICKVFGGIYLQIIGVVFIECGSWSLVIVDGVQIVLGDCEQVVCWLCCFFDVYLQVVVGYVIGFVYVDLCYINGFVVCWFLVIGVVNEIGVFCI